MGTPVRPLDDDGTSPREWGKLPRLVAVCRRRRNHPHASGENVSKKELFSSLVGTSPREWGKRRASRKNRLPQRNIPTRVGKTNPFIAFIVCVPEHPHACGENNRRTANSSCADGTSPRMWGKRRQEPAIERDRRNIPTHVGKTSRGTTPTIARSEHPHACGENSRRRRISSMVAGTSPRMWGKLNRVGEVGRVRRNIPTHVGKTMSGTSSAPCSTEHPHACGENCIKPSALVQTLGTSPREWGKPRKEGPVQADGRNIPTRVGKTPIPFNPASFQPEHPHASGEIFAAAVFLAALSGTSPREWGKHASVLPADRLPRNIPTRVGKTLLCTSDAIYITEHPNASGEN